MTDPVTTVTNAAQTAAADVTAAATVAAGAANQSYGYYRRATDWIAAHPSGTLWLAVAVIALLIAAAVKF